MSEPSFLFVMKAKSGSLMKTPDGIWKLTLNMPDDKVIYFSDRPYRIAGSSGSQKFISDWKEFGFDKNPPNAAVSLDPKLNKGEDQDTVIVTLQNPLIDPLKQTITFTILQSGNPSGSLESFKKKMDQSVPEQFMEPILFIDLSDLITGEYAESFNSYTLQG